LALPIQRSPILSGGFLLKTARKPAVMCSRNYPWMSLKPSIKYTLLYIACNMYVCNKINVHTQVKWTVIFFLITWKVKRERERDGRKKNKKEESESEPSTCMKPLIISTGNLVKIPNLNNLQSPGYPGTFTLRHEARDR
jgi:hypothetical protein